MRVKRMAAREVEHLKQAVKALRMGTASRVSAVTFPFLVSPRRALIVLHRFTIVWPALVFICAGLLPVVAALRH